MRQPPLPAATVLLAVVVTVLLAAEATVLLAAEVILLVLLPVLLREHLLVSPQGDSVRPQGPLPASRVVSVRLLPVSPGASVRLLPVSPGASARLLAGRLVASAVGE